MFEHGELVRVVGYMFLADIYGIKMGDVMQIRKDSLTDNDVHLVKVGSTDDFGFYVDEIELVAGSIEKVNL